MHAATKICAFRFAWIDLNSVVVVSELEVCYKLEDHKSVIETDFMVFIQRNGSSVACNDGNLVLS